MASKEYLEKLKSPEWQKKRLAILSRDEFRCQNCYDDESTLHIHHLRYVWGNDPWEAPDEDLITLCESCHQGETAGIKPAMAKLTNVVKCRYLSGGIEELARGLEQCISTLPGNVIASIINTCLTTPELWEQIESMYWEHLQTKYLNKTVTNVNP